MVKADPTAVKDSLLHELSLAKTPQDSIPLLYHLYDLAGRTDKRNYNNLLFNAARHCNNYKVQLDIIRNTCNIYTSSDSAMAICQTDAELLPQSDDQKETITFIKVNRISRNARASSEADRQKMLQKLIGEYKQTSNADIYENVLRLYTLCIYLGSSTQGELYTEYLGKLEKLIKQLPSEGRHALPNLFYTQSAIIYTQNEEYAKAIAADKELLKIIEQLTKDYKAQGRIFRNFDTNYYNCYRRILSNYPALSRDEVESYYQKILELCKINTTIDNDYHSSGRPLIYYLMASQRYSEALPYLKKYINAPDNTRSRMQLLKLLTEAATAVGDNTTLLQTTTEYNKMLEEYNHLKAAEKYKELQILYDVNELKNQNAQLELEKREAEIKSSRTVIHITFIAISVLLFLLAITCWLYYRTKRLAGSLQRSKQKLQEEQHVLLQTQKELTIARDQAEGANRMKTLFIQNMSHEIRTPLNSINGFSEILSDDFSTPEEQKDYQLIIQENTRLLTSLLHSLVEVVNLDSLTASLTLKPIEINHYCRLEMQYLEETEGKPEIDYQLNLPENDYKVYAHPQYLSLLLRALLNTANKFTTQGFINLSCRKDSRRKMLMVSVTDTGCGVPTGKHEYVFRRFTKLDTFRQGSGLGLYLCKLIIRHMQGDIYIDKTYTKGSRFIFTLPMENAKK